MKPYYEHGGITIYNCDCRELLPTLETFVVITDPPYGVGLGATTGTGNGHGLVRTSYSMIDDSYESWRAEVLPRIELALSRARRAAVFTGPHLQDQPKASAIGGVYCAAGAGRHPWGFKTFLPVLFYGTAPNLNKGAKPNTIASNATSEKFEHPCPKPLEWMQWLVGLVSEPSDVVVDPFMGTGTTLVAAKLEGRTAIGCDISERYCEIAANRLAQGVLF